MTNSGPLSCPPPLRFALCFAYLATAKGKPVKGNGLTVTRKILKTKNRERKIEQNVNWKSDSRTA
jgi:hypothetical protein